MCIRDSHSGGYSKTRHKKLVTYAESDASAVNLLESREQRCIKANSSNNIIPFLFMLQTDVWFVGPVL